MKKHLLQIPCSAMPFICEADYSVAMAPMIHVDRTAPFHVAIYLLKGWMEIIEDGTAHEIAPHQLFFLKSGVRHWGERSFEPGSAWYYAHFYCDGPQPGGRELTLRAAGEFLTDNRQEKLVYTERENETCYITLPKLTDCAQEGKVEREFQKLVGAHRCGNIPETSIHLWNIFMGSARTEREPETDNAYAKNLVEYVGRHYAENFTAQDIERVSGLSYKYAGTLFKEATGRTIKEYQYMLRLDQAERLLRETDRQISEIALLTGFSDVFYFSRIFHRERGCSPSQYRHSYIPGI